MKSTRSQLLLSAAVAGMIGAGAIVLATDSSLAASKSKETQVKCYGLNSCKGKGSCAIAGLNTCKGHNSCKGKGFSMMTKAQCMAKKGKLEPPKATKTT